MIVFEPGPSIYAGGKRYLTAIGLLSLIFSPSVFLSLSVFMGLHSVIFHKQAGSEESKLVRVCLA